MVPILINDRLRSILESKGISPEHYRPAYDGESVGLDLYYTGLDNLHWHWGGTPQFPYLRKGRNQYGDMILEDVKWIPTGVRVVIPRGFVGLILDRGSISKTSLFKRAGVIDPGYTDEIFVNLVKPLDSKSIPADTMPGDKLPVQLIVVPVDSNFQVVSEDVFNSYHFNSKRGDGKVGSSDV